MTSSIELYKKMASATDDETRAHIIAEAFEERYPSLSDVAAKTDLSETELRLTKEIEETRGEIKVTELRLAKEIEEIRGKLEETRGEIKATELRLQKEIKETELRLVNEIGQAHVGLTRAMHRQTVWVVGSVSVIIGLLRFLDMVTG